MTGHSSAERLAVVLTERVTAVFRYATALHATKPRSDTTISYARIFSQSRNWIWRPVVTKI